MAALTCAQELMQRGMDVVVFDKGRGLGGRMANRRASGGFQFDHGAPSLSSHRAGFSAMLKDAQAAGAAAPWAHDDEDAAYDGVPGMTGLAKYLGRDLTIRKETRIDAVVHAQGRWTLMWDGGQEAFDRVVVKAPAPQIDALFPEGHSFNTALEAVAVDPFLTLMVCLSSGDRLPFSSLHQPHEDIYWIICDSDTPGRPNATSLVAHASTNWSLRHLELDRDVIAKKMLPMVSDVTGADIDGDPAYIAGHRWRSAFVSRPLGQPFLVNADQTLFAGGDWCLGPRGEDAWSSGQAIARQIAEGPNRCVTP